MPLASFAVKRDEYDRILRDYHEMLATLLPQVHLRLNESICQCTNAQSLTCRFRRLPSRTLYI